MKKNNDILITAISKNKKISGYITFLTDTLKKAQDNHGMNIISTSIFGRAMAASVLLSGNLKNKKDILFLKWNCTGPVDSIFVEVNYNGHLKGYIANNILEYIDGSLTDGFVKAEPYIGFGEIVVSRKTFDSRLSYNSISVIESGEIAEDISMYLKQSLQINSALNIGISIDNQNEVEVCGGLMLMAMPGLKEEEVVRLKEDFLSLGSYTNLLKEHSDNINKVIDRILSKFDLEIITQKEINFKCNCNQNKIIMILKSLHYEDFTDYITEDGMIKAECQYCGKKYNFLPKEVEKFK